MPGWGVILKIRSARVRRPVGVGSGSNTSHLTELEQLDLRVEMAGWDHVREINRRPGITCSVASRDQAAVLAHELPKGPNEFSPLDGRTRRPASESQTPR